MADDRIRKLSFSSEQAIVPRWFGNEILDHSPGSVRTAFLDSGRAPLLLNHDRYSQPVGVIEKDSVKIGKDRIARASARFGRTTNAVDALTNVDDEIMCNTSVGYRVHEMRFDCEKDGVETYRVTDWEPNEISLVGIPADTTVGVGRGHNSRLYQGAATRPQEKGMADETPAAGSGAAEQGAAGAAAGGGSGAVGSDASRGADAQTRIDVVRSEQQYRSAMELEQGRIKTIKTLARANNIDERMQQMWITGGTNVEQVADDILRIVRERGESKPTSAAAIGLTDQETQRFSLIKAIRAVADKNWSKAGFELECSRAVATRLNRVPEENKFFVPFEVLRRAVPRSAIDAHASSRMYGANANPLARQPIEYSRADVVGTSTAGGYLVETINLSFIELLRNRTVSFRLGATVLSGLVGNVNIPKQTGAATAMWLSTETTQITEVEQTFGQLSFSPHTVGGYTEISRLLLLQSSPDIEGIVNADLAAIIGIALDSAVISGSGSSGQPHGIIGLTGVGNPGSMTSLGLAGLLQFQADVGGANVVPVRGGWAAPFNVSKLLRARNEFSNTYSPLWYGSIWDGMMLGYPSMASNQIPSGDLIFGDWAQVVVAEWGVLEVEVNPYANFQAGIIGIRALLTVDVGIRYPAAFDVGTTVT